MRKVISVMKKVMLITLLFAVGGIHTHGAPVQVSMQIINKSSSGAGPTYAPPRPWYITQDDYVLTLPAFEDDFTLELRDEDDAVVYSTIVPAGTTLVVLPSTLSGDFELRLVADTYYYIGFLSL